LALDGWHSWPFRRRATASAVRDLGADVVGLQEVYGFQRRWLMRQLPDDDSYGLGRNDGRRGESCPVLIKRASARLLDANTRWYGEESSRPGTRLPDSGFPRVATIIRLQLALETDAEIVIVNTHLDEANAANRVRSLEQLLEWLDLDVPHVVMGDLNAPAGDEALTRLEGAGLRSALPVGAGGTTHNFTGRLDGPQIDHIFVTEHWDVVAARIVNDITARPLPSDHWPIVADLRLR
jgi:endonuclease/exonuclease/phosphatase family metal-dependent hydrolase